MSFFEMTVWFFFNPVNDGDHTAHFLMLQLSYTQSMKPVLWEGQLVQFSAILVAGGNGKLPGSSPPVLPSTCPGLKPPVSNILFSKKATSFCKRPQTSKIRPL